MRIGELAEAAGLTTKAIRFYEQEGLLPQPARTSSGCRDYSVNALTRLRFIRSAQAAGLTLAEIGEVLASRDAGQPPCRHVTSLIDQHLKQIRQRILTLQAAEAELQRLADHARSLDPATCTDEDICQIIHRA